MFYIIKNNQFFLFCPYCYSCQLMFLGLDLLWDFVKQSASFVVTMLLSISPSVSCPAEMYCSSSSADTLPSFPSLSSSMFVMLVVCSHLTDYLRTVVVQLPSPFGLFATPWTAVHQASLSFTIS